MSTPGDIVTAIKARLETITGVSTWEFVPGATDYPALFLNPIPVIDYRDSADNDELYEYEIVLLVSAAFAELQQLALPFLARTGLRSVFDVFESNRSLGLTDVDAHIRGVRPLGLEEVAGYRAYGAVFQLIVAHGPQ